MSANYMMVINQHTSLGKNGWTSSPWIPTTEKPRSYRLWIGRFSRRECQSVNSTCCDVLKQSHGFLYLSVTVSSVGGGGKRSSEFKLHCVFWLCVINYSGAHVPISPGTNEILRRENMAASSKWMFLHLKDYFSQFTEQVIGKYWHTQGVNVLCYS